LSACSEIFASSATKDLPHHALDRVLAKYKGGGGKASIPSILVDIFLQLLVVDLALFIAHRHGLVNGIRKFLSVPGIDHQTPIQALCSPSKLGKHKLTMTLLLTSNVLKRDQIHSIPSRRDKTDIGDSVESHQLVESDGLVHEVDWHKLDSAWAVRSVLSLMALYNDLPNFPLILPTSSFTTARRF